MNDLTYGSHLRRNLARRLDAFQHRETTRPGHRRAAVVLAVLPNEGSAASLLLTRRASGLRQHGGQFALPGGKIEPGESSIEAGLRELAEEVGVDLGPKDILGRLDDFLTHSGFVITPFVAWAGQPSLSPDPNEVAAVYRIPLAELGRPEALVQTRFFGDDPIPALHLPTADNYVFSPTAAILHQFAELAVHGRETRTHHFVQPEFARR